MSTIRVDVDKLPTAIRADLRARRKGVGKGLRVAAERARSFLVKITPVDMGQMRNAWRVKLSSSLKGIRGATVINDAPYAGIIEAGARPHNVSREGVEAIRGWVARHFAGAEESEIEGVTWAIVNKIKTQPTEGHWLVRGNMDKFKRFAEQEVSRAVARAVK